MRLVLSLITALFLVSCTSSQLSSADIGTVDSAPVQVTAPELPQEVGLVDLRPMVYPTGTGKLMTACAADVDGDGEVTKVDEQIVQDNPSWILGFHNYNPAYDIDGDGVVNSADQIALRNALGGRCRAVQTKTIFRMPKFVFTSCDADLNTDGVVDELDVELVVENLGVNSSIADLNRDDHVTFAFEGTAVQLADGSICE